MGTFFRALKIAISFLMIPRLFLSLIFFPLLLSLLIVCGQLVMTGLFVQSIVRDTGTRTEVIKDRNQKSLIRKIVYGSFDPLPEIIICRWAIDEEGDEVPPSEECSPDRLDVALHVKDPQNFDVTEYERIFNGNFERVHICKSCQPDIVISLLSEKGPESMVLSTVGIGLVRLSVYHQHVQERYIKAAEELGRTIELFGDVHLNLPGFRAPIKITGLNESVVGLMNISMLIVIALWLAVRAHRNVLDYFVRNGALLPMVSSTGKQAFYASIWIITGARVLAFLGAAIPVVVLWFFSVGSKDGLLHQFGGNALEFSLWLIAICFSFGLATIIASIAELKHRHTVINFTYRYLPLLFCFLGAALWMLSFIFDGSGVVAESAPATFRAITAAIPIIGLAPVLVAPIFKPTLWVLVVHTLLSIIAILMITRYNSQWFAAHLEEI